MKKIIILAILSISINCHKNEKQVNDPAWRMESLQMAESMCAIFKKCSINKLNLLKPVFKDYTESKMELNNCIEIHKKSRVYLLKGYPPETIKKNTQECVSQIKKMTCEQLYKNQMEDLKSCQVMRKIQQGESL